MSDVQRHVIRREYIELAVDGSEPEGWALQNRLTALCRDELTPALDTVFANMVSSDEHWQFERIEVDAGGFTPETFERDFVATVVTAVKRQIRAHAQRGAAMATSADAAAVRSNDTQSSHDAFLHFLATGLLPWWYRLPAGQTLEAVTDASLREGQGWMETARAALLATLAAPEARLRLARQFSTAFLERLLECLVPGALAELCRAESMLRGGTAEGTGQDVSEAGWLAAFACLARQRAFNERNLREAWRSDVHVAAESTTESAPGIPSSRPRMRAPAADELSEESHPPRVDTKFQPHIGAVPRVPGTVPAARTPELDLSAGIFIDCAGVVLLHPFLRTLFERLQVVVDHRLVQPDRALALLHFLASGEPSAPEHALALPKLLCGLSILAPAPPPVELTAAEQGEADALLAAVIGHWSALGDTSPDVLRGTFLTRPGKLSRQGDEDVLQLEQQSFDVLLGQMPWGVGMVLLPWMQRLLRVEWPY